MRELATIALRSGKREESTGSEPTWSRGRPGSPAPDNRVAVDTVGCKDTGAARRMRASAINWREMRLKP
jgi:hypothetical protein